jgi:hypothetical protein
MSEEASEVNKTNSLAIMIIMVIIMKMNSI